MHAVVRHYPDASALDDALEQHRDEVAKILKDVPGFVGWYALRSGDVVTTVTVCEDQVGAEESTRRAADWVKRRLEGVAMKPPVVTAGEVFMEVRPKRTSTTPSARRR